MRAINPKLELAGLFQHGGPIKRAEACRSNTFAELVRVSPRSIAQDEVIRVCFRHCCRSEPSSAATARWQAIVRAQRLQPSFKSYGFNIEKLGDARCRGHRCRALGCTLR